jgi:hypothetical protein
MFSFDSRISLANRWSSQPFVKGVVTDLHPAWGETAITPKGAKCRAFRARLSTVAPRSHEDAADLPTASRSSGIGRLKVPAGQSAVSQAVAHSAKSAVRGSFGRWVSGRRLRLTTIASRSTPRTFDLEGVPPGSAPASGTRRGRLKLARVTMSSMPFDHRREATNRPYLAGVELPQSLRGWRAGTSPSI